MYTARATLVLVSVIGASLGGSPRAEPASLPPTPPAVVVRGAGPAVVLLSGLLGGTARLNPLADRLIDDGFRVVLVDPYRLAAATADVSFHGLARTVGAALRRKGVGSAVVVAHAHAAGVAVRLAADAPELVTHLVLLDAGVVPSTRSTGVARATRMAALIAQLPGGPSFIRARLVSGIRANSGDPAWVSEAVARDYTEPLMAELPAVARMAARLADAREPEAVELILRRVTADVTVLIGGAAHAITASDEELAYAARIRGVRVRHLEGVGHFVHEEAPGEVVAEVLGARRTAQAGMR